MGLVLSESKTDLWPQAFQMERTAKRGCMLGGDRAGFGMSLHRSLRSGGATAAKRNVLKRFERVTLLKKRGQWKAGMKSTGLPKTKPE